MSASNAGEPGFKDAADLVVPGHDDGSTGLNDCDGLRIGCADRADQLVLLRTEIESLQVDRFSGPLVAEDDGDVSLARNFSCGRRIVARVIDDFGIREFGLYRFKWRVAEPCWTNEAIEDAAAWRRRGYG